MSPTDLFKNSGHNNIKSYNGRGGRADCSSSHKYVLTQPLLTTTSRHVMSFNPGYFFVLTSPSPSLSPSLAGLHLHLHISYNLGFFSIVKFLWHMVTTIITKSTSLVFVPNRQYHFSASYKQPSSVFLGLSFKNRILRLLDCFTAVLDGQHFLLQQRIKSWYLKHGV